MPFAFVPAQGSGSEEELFRALSNGARRWQFFTYRQMRTKRDSEQAKNNTFDITPANPVAAIIFSLITHCQHSSAEVALSPVSKIVEFREMEGADRGDAPDAGLASAVCLLQPLRRQPPPACRPPAAHRRAHPARRRAALVILYCEQSRGLPFAFAPAQGAGAEEELFRALSNGARRRGSAIHASRHNPATPPPRVEFCRIRVRYMRRYIYISSLCLLFAVGNPVCAYLRSSGEPISGAAQARRGDRAVRFCCFLFSHTEYDINRQRIGGILFFGSALTICVMCGTSCLIYTVPDLSYLMRHASCPSFPLVFAVAFVIDEPSAYGVCNRSAPQL